MGLLTYILLDEQSAELFLLVFALKLTDFIAILGQPFFLRTRASVSNPCFPLEQTQTMTVIAFCDLNFFCGMECGYICI